MTIPTSIRPACTLDFLSRYYGPNLTLRDLSSITTQHEQTIRNSVYKGEYPIPSFKIGGKRLFRLMDVAAYIDQQYAAANTPVKTPKRGRPTKVEQIARRQAAMNTTATKGW